MTTYRQRLEERFPRVNLETNVTFGDLFGIAELLDQAPPPREKAQGTNPIANMVESWAEPFGTTDAPENDAISSSEAQWLITLAQKDERIKDLESELSEMTIARDLWQNALVEVREAVTGKDKPNLLDALNTLDVPAWHTETEPVLVDAIRKATDALGEFKILKDQADKINATLKPLDLPGPSVVQAVEQLAAQIAELHGTIRLQNKMAEGRVPREQYEAECEKVAKLETMLKEQYVEKWRLVEAERRGHELFKILEEFGDGVCHLVEKAGGPPHHKVYGWTSEDANRAPMRASMYWLEQRLKDQPKAESTVKPPAFGDALVERLAQSAYAGIATYEASVGVVLDAWEDQGRGSKNRTIEAVRAILAEQAKTNVELPTDDATAERLADRWVREDGGENAKEDEIVAIRRALAWANDRVAPILAAKDARIAELEARTPANDDQNAKAAQYEITIKQQKARIEDLEKDDRHCIDAMSESNLVPPGRTLLEGISELIKLHETATKKIEELEKRLAEQSVPSLVDGKTPGEVWDDAFSACVRRAGLSRVSIWNHTSPETRAMSEEATQAVLDTFGKQRTREVLERVRNSIANVERMSSDSEYGKQWANVDELLETIDAELAKLGQAKSKDAKTNVADYRPAQDVIHQIREKVQNLDKYKFDFYKQGERSVWDASFVKEEHVIEILDAELAALDSPTKSAESTAMNEDALSIVRKSLENVRGEFVMLCVELPGVVPVQLPDTPPNFARKPVYDALNECISAELERMRNQVT